MIDPNPANAPKVDNLPDAFHDSLSLELSAQSTSDTRSRHNCRKPSCNQWLHGTISISLVMYLFVFVGDF
jgi:hypothetical protein